ncbi:MAG: M23 family metallopeptidase [Sediminibacterium sp.]|nr:M23 family metallopeptidase [Sediminibacterium sp.]
MKRNVIYGLLGIAILAIVVGLMPPKIQMPVKGAGRSDYDQGAFWAYPWGKSVTHKGVDIFAERGSDVIAAESGLVVYTGQLSLGGNVVLVLSAGWRFHYYAHLQSIETGTGKWLKSGTELGKVGSSGNAAGKPPHLHYSIQTIVPRFWKYSDGMQGWKKMFYLNPVELLNEATK